MAFLNLVQIEQVVCKDCETCENVSRCTCETEIERKRGRLWRNLKTVRMCLVYVLQPMLLTLYFN
jgi:hypothetical protein